MKQNVHALKVLSPMKEKYTYIKANEFNQLKCMYIKINEPN